jgi:hypothetical protein
VSGAEDRFRRAARAYFAYGVVYWLGGTYLVWQGVGVRGAMGAIAWMAAGALVVVLVPFLLRRPRGWFDRFILCRRDFARVLALFMAFRAFKVGQIAVRGEGAAVPAPWGGVVTFQAGAVVFFLVTVMALVFVALAAWGPERTARA